MSLDGGFRLPPGQSNVPSTTRANGRWSTREANNRWSGLNYEWPNGQDPYFSSVKCLLHGYSTKVAGTVDSILATDSSPSPTDMRFFGLIGEIGVVNSGAKFGTQCMTCSAATSANFGSTSTSWAPSNGDWTIESWLYVPSAASGAIGFIYESRPNPPGVTTHISVAFNAGILQFYVGSLGVLINSSSSVPIDSWFHWAVCKATNQTRMFINGTQSGSTYADTNTYSGAGIILFNTSNTSSCTPCRMQEFRITQGVGRYTSTFPVPVYPFPDF